MVWNNTAHKVSICVIQCLHQLVQLFFVGLSDRSEHSLACCCSSSTKWADFCHGRRHAHDVRYSDKCMLVTSRTMHMHSHRYITAASCQSTVSFISAKHLLAHTNLTLVIIVLIISAVCFGNPLMNTLQWCWWCCVVSLWSHVQQVGPQCSLRYGDPPFQDNTSKLVPRR